MSTTVKGSIHDILDDIVPKTNCVKISSFKIIVAWKGVLTLAFEAWPKPIMDIKQRINDLPEFGYTSENFGTKWPKITLASLINDDVPPLTLDQLRNLTALCQEFDSELQQMDPITLSNCSIVLFSSRSLEHVLCRVDYAFKTSQDLPSNGNDQKYVKNHTTQSKTLSRRLKTLKSIYIKSIHQVIGKHITIVHIQSLLLFVFWIPMMKRHAVFWTYWNHLGSELINCYQIITNGCHKIHYISLFER